MKPMMGMVAMAKVMTTWPSVAARNACQRSISRLKTAHTVMANSECCREYAGHVLLPSLESRVKRKRKKRLRVAKVETALRYFDTNLAESAKHNAQPPPAI